MHPFPIDVIFEQMSTTWQVDDCIILTTTETVRNGNSEKNFEVKKKNRKIQRKKISIQIIKNLVNIMMIKIQFFCSKI